MTQTRLARAPTDIHRQLKRCYFLASGYSTGVIKPA
jgi:hypothetical protein